MHLPLRYLYTIYNESTHFSLALIEYKRIIRESWNYCCIRHKIEVKIIFRRIYIELKSTWKFQAILQRIYKIHAVDK